MTEDGGRRAYYLFYRLNYPTFIDCAVAWNSWLLNLMGIDDLPHDWFAILIRLSCRQIFYTLYVMEGRSSKEWNGEEGIEVGRGSRRGGDRGGEVGECR